MDTSHRQSGVYLIDASIYVFQAYFSSYLNYSDQNGEDLSAFIGFGSFMLRFLERAKPAYAVVAGDESLFTGFRHELDPGYKSNRSLPDANLERQLQACAELCHCLGVRYLASSRYEADDIIGNLVRMFRSVQQDLSISILTRDKDLAQLLWDEHIQLWDFSADKKSDRNDFIGRAGIQPEQLSDYLALVGDSVDCILGVPGVGPKKATALLQQFSNLESLLDNIDAVEGMSFRGARQTALALVEYADQARLAKRLATIECYAQSDESFVKLSLDDVKLMPASLEATAELLDDMLLSEEDRARFLTRLTTLSQASLQ